MSSWLSDSGKATAIVLIGLMLLTIPAGMALAQGVTTSPTITDAAITPTLPPVNLTDTPTETPTDNGTTTPTPTATPADSPDGGGAGNASGDGKRLVVDKGSSPAGGVTADENCSNAEYTVIQRAVDDAAPGDTVVVCAGTYTESVTVDRGNLTLRAVGDAVIESSGQPAVRSTAPRVTIRGFTIRTTGAEYSIGVGGRDSLVRDNTVELTGNSTGIFLSDGRSATGAPDRTLGAATGSRVVQNTVNGSQNTFSLGVFTDADQTVVRNNTFFGEDNTTSISSGGNRTVIRGNTIRHLNPCSQVAFHPGTECNAYNKPPAILIGKYNQEMYYSSGGALCGGPGDNSTHGGHNWARQNRIVNNSIIQSPGEGLHIMGTGTHSKILAAIQGTVVKNNHFKNTGGISGWSNGAVYRNNTVDADHSLHEETQLAEGDNENALCLHAHDTQIIGNTLNGYTGPNTLITGAQNVTIRNNEITFGNPGIRVSMQRGHWKGEMEVVESIRIINNTMRNGSSLFGNVVILENVSEFSDNTITGSRSDGIRFSGTGGFSSTNQLPEISEFHHNRITGNSQTGILLSPNVTVTEFHHNLIDNNGYLGINKENQDKTDDRWPIVNATRNIWGCGGPSGGLQDPKTGRVANGTGDAISAGDKAGVSNVRFDPFYVRQDVSCPNQTSNPTPTPTATPTPTPTPTPGGSGGSGPGDDTSGEDGEGGEGGTGGTGGDDGAGSGEGSGDGDGSGDTTGGESGSGGDQATPPPKPQSPTATPTDTPTATPTRTSPPTDTATPTPAVEPGFGILTWLVGVVLALGLLALRRREGTHD